MDKTIEDFYEKYAYNCTHCENKGEYETHDINCEGNCKEWGCPDKPIKCSCVDVKESIFNMGKPLNKILQQAKEDRDTMWIQQIEKLIQSPLFSLQSKDIMIARILKEIQLIAKQ